MRQITLILGLALALFSYFALTQPNTAEMNPDTDSSVTLPAEMQAQLAPRGAFIELTEIVLRTPGQTFEISDASEVEVLVFTFNEAIETAWHKHHAPALVIVNSGQFIRQYEDCSTSVYGPGEVSIHPGLPADRTHRAYFTAGTELGLVFFGVPPGEERSVYDVEAPDCEKPSDL
jgi:quercetin dioxygenase-like cupin family protein